MATQLQLRGGTTSQCTAITPAAREVLVDTTLNSLRVGDGATAGGTSLATAAQVANTAPLGGANTVSSGTSCAYTSGTFTAPSAGKLIVFADFFAAAGGALSAVTLTTTLSGLVVSESGFQANAGAVRGYLPMTKGQTTTVTATATAATATTLTAGVFAFFLPGA
jgi:hypothetical protein